MTTTTTIMMLSCKYIYLWEVTHCTHFSVKASPDTRISRSQTILDRSLFTTQAVWKLITSDTNILSCPRHLYRDNYCREKTRKWSWKNFLERGAQYDSTAPVGSTPTSAPTESDVDWGRNLLEPRKSRAPGRKKKKKKKKGTSVVSSNKKSERKFVARHTENHWLPELLLKSCSSQSVIPSGFILQRPFLICDGLSTKRANGQY